MRSIITTIACLVLSSDIQAQVLEDFECPVWPCPSWTAVSGSTGYVSTLAAHDAAQGFIDDGTWYTRTASVGAPGDRLSMWVRHTGSSARTYLGFAATAGGCKSFVFASNTMDIRFQENVGFSYSELNVMPFSIAMGEWYRIEIIFVDSFTVTGNLFAADGATLLATLNQNYPGGILAGNIALRSFGDHHGDTIGTGTAAPSCSISTPAGVATRDVSFTVSVSSMSAPTLSIGFDASTDGGTSWTPATASPSSPLTNPAVGVAVGMASFVWDSAADGVATLAPVSGVLMRATVNDGVATTAGQCSSAPFIVDNSAVCLGICGDCNQDSAGPSILDALMAAQIAAALISPSQAQRTCCDVDANTRIDILDALRIAQGAAGIPITLTCP